MDFPKSVPGVGLVNGVFVDEDQVKGTPGSLIPAAWGTSITRELLNVIQAAGIVPDENNSSQLLDAITGHINALKQTAAQFDNTTKLASTAFVQRALGNFRGEAVYSVDTALTADAFGRVVILAGSTAGSRTFTLPSASLGVPGARILLWNNSAFSLTVVPAAGNALDNGTSLPASIVVGPGSSLEVLCLPNSLYRVVGGTANLKASSEFAASFGFNGYHRLPSGVIEQWGSASALAASEIRTVTLPVAYPTGVRCVVLTGDGSNSQVRVAALGTATFQIQNLGTAQQNCYWRAIGH